MIYKFPNYLCIGRRAALSDPGPQQVLSSTMVIFLFQRFLQAVGALFATSIVVFLLLYLIPGDPIRVMASPHARQDDIERLRERWGLNEPLPLQYFNWLRNTLRGDLGESVRMRILVSSILWPRYFNTLWLTTVSMGFAVLLGLSVGIAASVKRGSIFDISTMFSAIVGFSIPPFWLGLLLILAFNVHLNWLPSGGGDTWRHMILPVISLGTASSALIARMTRSAMLEVLHADFIRTARAKGLAQQSIIIFHALRNALIPVVTIVGLQFGILMAGAVITEVVFTWPGIGRLLVESILNRDFPIVRATLLITSATFIVINLLVDMLYAYLDPRIKF